MRIGFYRKASLSVSVLFAGLLLAQSSGTSLKLENGATITAKTRTGQTVLEVANSSANRRPSQILLKRDQYVAPNSEVTLKKVGQAGPHVVILTDTYDSLPKSLSFCQAGEEQFLRVIELSPIPRQTLQVKLKSCRSSLDLADGGLVWNPSTSTLDIRWLPNPTPTAVEKRSSVEYKINEDGSTAVLTESKRPSQP